MAQPLFVSSSRCRHESVRSDYGIDTLCCLWFTSSIVVAGRSDIRGHAEAARH